MSNARSNIKDNPEMKAIEERAQTLWRFNDKNSEEWLEYKSCIEQLSTYWMMEERKNNKGKS
jgi:hypothetical protein